MAATLDILSSELFTNISFPPVAIAWFRSNHFACHISFGILYGTPPVGAVVRASAIEVTQFPALFVALEALFDRAGY